MYIYILLRRNVYIFFRVTNAPGPQRLGNDRDVSAKDATIPPRNTNGEQRNFQVLDM